MYPTSQIRDLRLAPEGHRKIDWVRPHMPILNQLRTEFAQTRPFAGRRLVLCLHLEAKTAYLARVLQAGGAEVTVVASNPLSTQDDVVAALVDSGIRAFAWHGATVEEYRRHLNLALDCHPDAIIDDGGDVVALLHAERSAQLPEILGGCEETTTGVLRLRAMEREGQLHFPMIAVNDAYMKYLFDNRYGTGQSVWDGIMRTTNLVVAGKTVVVIGYGWCGKGVALRAKGLGAKVVVTEIDPIKANEAIMDGFQVLPLIEAASIGDVFITVTGNINVIRREHFAVMKDQAILANAGHFDVEISKPDLFQMAVSSRTVRRNIEEFVFADGRRVYLLAEGRLVNLAAGDGHPAEVMDLSFSLQALSLKYLIANRANLVPKVHPVPAEIDQQVARLRLKALGITIDTLTPEQERYLASWAD
ncbi:MAG: adenosylhomocysteinase [Firmicutes bacterium]|nr:adenosylhomocysteinase [Bacillota bacterium]